MTLLTEVLLDLALPSDAPFVADRCGSCRQCVEACPTGCILPDRTIDARRCISYLTIEARGGIPRDLRRSVGEWFFGCDICQQVCPWNRRFARPTSDAAFAPRPALHPPDLRRWLAVPSTDDAQVLRRSPLKRARRNGLARNAAVVAGNRRADQHLPALEQALRRDSDPMVRGHAAWALGEYRSAAAREALLRAQARETDAGVLAEINAALTEV